ncbi:hypothetical protein F4679DRAFT_589652 [Xylaria curta]|nr:hypothetical protein F4679DRAFT_589652 [Xylaria curta]
MARVTDLPCEVIIAVFKQLNRIRFLLSCLLTCRHFYYSYKANPRLAIEIIKQQVGPALLTYSIAAQEASRSPSPHVRLSATKLLETLRNKPDILIDRLRDYPLVALVQLGHMHDLVEKYANEFAAEAWRYTNEPLLQPSDRFPFSDRLSLSPTEQFRFYRAFYRVELYFRLFRDDNTRTLIDQFFSGHSPWENEQLACINKYLCQKYYPELISWKTWSESIGLTHSAPHGTWYSLRTDYWVSKGLDLINQLENTTSRKEQQSLLTAGYRYSSYFRHPDIRYYSAMQSATAADYYERGGSLTALYKDKEDSDIGPLTAWKETITWAGETWIAENKANRLYAYVLWDLTRIQKYDMLNFFLVNQGETVGCGGMGYRSE